MAVEVTGCQGEREGQDQQRPAAPCAGTPSIHERITPPLEVAAAASGAWPGRQQGAPQVTSRALGPAVHACRTHAHAGPGRQTIRVYPIPLKSQGSGRRPAEPLRPLIDWNSPPARGRVSRVRAATPAGRDAVGPT